MGSVSRYSIPLIRSAEGAMPPEDVKEGGKFLLVVTGDFAGATMDLHIKYEGHPEEVDILGIQQNSPMLKMTPPLSLENPTTEVWLPVGTVVEAAIMGGSPTSVNVTLVLVA